jgi:hypothetical protein
VTKHAVIKQQCTYSDLQQLKYLRHLIPYKGKLKYSHKRYYEPATQRSAVFTVTLCEELKYVHTYCSQDASVRTRFARSKRQANQRVGGLTYKKSYTVHAINIISQRQNSVVRSLISCVGRRSSVHTVCSFVFLLPARDVGETHRFAPTTVHVIKNNSYRSSEISVTLSCYTGLLNSELSGNCIDSSSSATTLDISIC